MIEVIQWIWEHRQEPITLLWIGSFILVVIDRLGRNLINHQLKRVFNVGSKSEFKQFSRNQRIIMENQRRMMEKMGVEPCAIDSKNCFPISAKKNKSFSTSRLAENTTALIARIRIKSHIPKRRMNMSTKLKSRKFWMAVVSALLIILNDGLGLGINNETVLAFAGLVATWIIGQAAVDAKEAGKGDKTDAQHYGDHGPSV